MSHFLHAPRATVRVKYANFKGREVAVEVTHVPAWGGGLDEMYEGILRISREHDDEALWPFNGRKVTVMAMGVTDEVFLAEDDEVPSDP